MEIKTYLRPDHRYYSEVIKVLNKFVPKRTLLEKNPEALAQISGFNEFTRTFPGILCILDYSTRKYVFMSANSADIIGYRPDEFYEYGIAMSMTIFPEGQREVILTKIFPIMFECIERHSREGKAKDIRISFDSLMTHPDGKVSWFLNQLTVIETDELNRAHLVLKLITDIKDIKKDNNITFNISKKSTNGGYETIFSETFFPKAVEENLSSREVEILKLIDQGKTSKEISDLLFISTHTVKTHRKNMLKKMNINSTSALLKNIDQGSL